MYPNEANPEALTLHILDLPGEILSLIFISSLFSLSQEHTYSPPFPFLEADAALALPLGTMPTPVRNTFIAHTLRLAAVCRTFHAVAWGTPQLWNRIAITVGMGMGRQNLEGKGRVKAFEKWLERSGGCALSLRVEWGGRSGKRCSGFNTDTDRWCHAEAEAAVNVIAKHAERWREVCLILPLACFTRLESAADLPGRSAMEKLQRLALLRHPYSAIEEGEGERITAFLSAHTLNELTLLGIPVQLLDAQWDRLTRFTGYFLRDDAIVDVLRLAPRLVDSTFAWCLGNTSAGAAPIVHTQHDAVRMLRIAGRAGVLRHLTLPALTELELRTEKEAWGWSPQALLGLLMRSMLGCTLEVLRLTIGFVSDKRIVECLESLPGLRDFRLENLNDRVHSAFSDGVVRRFAVPEGEGKGRCVVVPRLESLEVVGCSCQFDVEVLGEMLESRWRGRGETRLRRFVLVGSQDSRSDISSEILSSLSVKRLVSEGMVVDIRRQGRRTSQ